MEERKYNHLFEQPQNISTLFLSRPIMSSINKFGKTDIIQVRDIYYEKGFTKCELDEDCINEGKVFITFNTDKNYKGLLIKNWNAFHNTIKESQVYINEFDIDINKIAVYLNFPKKWMNDYFNIIEGNYSKLSDNFMKSFYPNADSFLYHLKNKTPEAIDFYTNKFKVNEKLFDTCEIGPKMILEKEIFKVDIDINKILV